MTKTTKPNCPFCGGDQIMPEPDLVHERLMTCLECGSKSPVWNTRSAPSVKPLEFTADGYAHNGMGGMYQIAQESELVVSRYFTGSSETGLYAMKDEPEVLRLTQSHHKNQILTALET